MTRMTYRLAWRERIEFMTTRSRNPMIRVVLPRDTFPWRRLAPSLAAHGLLTLAALCAPLYLARTWPLPEPDVVVTFLDSEPEAAEMPILAERPIPALPNPSEPPAVQEAEALVVHQPHAEIQTTPEVPPIARPIDAPRTPATRRDAPVIADAGFDRLRNEQEPTRRRDVKTTLFPRATGAPSAIDRPPAQVQTGGFGDPDGVAVADTARRMAPLSRVGSFDLPSGPGHGIGTGGHEGARGALVSAGFGNGVATERNVGGDGPAARPVHAAGFADSTPVPAPSRPRPKVVEPTIVPAQIVSKPRPAYTDEARSRRVEGEVVLEVLFSAEGRSRVLRVVKGLGSGLDEQAVQAAERIVFKPASRDGRPVDFTATVRITFNLA